MKKIVHFGATSVSDSNSSMVLAPVSQAMLGTVSTEMAARPAIDMMTPTGGIATTNLGLVAPNHKRKYQHAFGAAGARLAHTPQPMGGMTPAMWP